MLIEPTVNIPALIQQGDTPAWVDQPFTDDLGNTYSASAYSLIYSVAGANALLTVNGVVTGVGWTTSLTVSQSNGLATGKNWWQAQLQALAGGTVITVASGELCVTVNLANAAAGYSGYSLAEQNLIAAQAELAKLTATESYRIAEREMKYRMTNDLLDVISYWNAVVINEKTQNSIAQNQGNPRKLYARFPSKFGSGA